MTFNDIENHLPNGFHDAKLVQINLDYANRALFLTMEVFIGEPGHHPNRDAYRRVQVKAGTFYFCVIEPPDHRYPYTSPKPIVSGDLIDVDKLRPLVERLPEHIAVYSFFVENWNSFIHVAADHVDFLWESET